MASDIILPDIILYRQDLENSKYGWPDQYGSSYIAAEYCNVSHNNIKLRHHWLHGCNGPWENAHPFLYVKYFPKNHYILVAREDQEKYLKSNGAQWVKAIGLPFAYLPEVDVNRKRDSILFMPTHLRAGDNYADTEMIKDYIDYILKFRSHFKDIAICLHSMFFSFPKFTEEFEKAEIKIIAGANGSDRNALLRQKMMLSQYEVVSTNGWGSHIAYALSCKCKISIDGPKIEKSKEDFYNTSSWKGREDVVDIMFSPNFIKERETFLKKFYVSPLEAVGDTALGNMLIGKENILSPRELSSLFKIGFGYRSKQFIDKILKKLKISI